MKFSTDRSLRERLGHSNRSLLPIVTLSHQPYFSHQPLLSRVVSMIEAEPSSLLKCRLPYITIFAIKTIKCLDKVLLSLLCLLQQSIVTRA